MTISTTHPQSQAARSTDRVVLLPSADGWSLLTTEGRLVHRALGYRARRECLEYARAAGIVALSH